MLSPEPFFLQLAEGPTGQRFALLHEGRHAAVQAAVLYVHPFAEEMNKSRRMAALQSRALAAAGCTVLQVDLMGCGDSAGDHGDATWSAWVDDVAAAARWLVQRCQISANASSGPPLWLWGHRLGSLLAAQASNQLDMGCNFMFWQPVTLGKSALRQFLRLRHASALVGGAGEPTGANLRPEAAADQAIEVAGYALDPSLRRSMEEATLHPPSRTGRSEWIEVSTRDQGSLSPATSSAVAAWAAAGWTAHAQVVQGPAFWQTTEIEDAPALIAATTAAILPSLDADRGMDSQRPAMPAST